MSITQAQFLFITVEWAEFNQNEAPFNHIEINVTYNDDDSRTYEFKSVGEDEIIEGLQK